jgi:hypothetical protein
LNFRGGTFKEILFNIYSDLTKDLESKKTDLESYANDTVIQNAKDEVDIYLTGTSKPELDTYTTTKKSEITSHTTTKIGEVTSHTTTKEAEITSHTDSKKSEITTHTEDKKTELNTYEIQLEGSLDDYIIIKKSELDDYTLTKISEIGSATGVVLQTSITDSYTGSSSSLVASQKALYDGLGTKLDYLDLSNQVQLTSYRYSVIALCELDNTDASYNSHSQGTLFLHRGNSLNADVRVNVDIAKKYNSTTPNITYIITGTSTSIKPCTFTYNGKKYGGLYIFISAAEYGYVHWCGVTNLDGGIFGLDYYQTNTETVLNSEVNSSINFSDFTLGNGNTFNGYNVYHEGNTGIKINGIDVTIETV